MRFLVIDDFSTMRKIIKKTLNEMGFDNIIEADDGTTAWAALEAAKTTGEEINFVISDWNMPKMSGFDLLKKCRADEKYKATPFVLVTAESEQSQIVDAIKNGCSDYIVKPFTAQVVKEKINRVYTKHYGQKAG